MVAVDEEQSHSGPGVVEAALVSIPEYRVDGLSVIVRVTLRAAPLLITRVNVAVNLLLPPAEIVSGDATTVRQTLDAESLRQVGVGGGAALALAATEEIKQKTSARAP
jgi:hypothetical protein